MEAFIYKIDKGFWQKKLIEKTSEYQGGLKHYGMCYTNTYKVYITGGLQVLNSTPVGTVYEFGASNYLLGMRRKSLNHVRYGHGTVSIKGAVYVFGGFAHRDAPGEAPRTISLCEKLSSSNASWDMVASMNKARAFAGACVLEQ